MKPQFLFAILFLLACSEPKTDYTINLNSEEGYGTFFTGQKNVDISEDSLHYKNVPEGIDEYVVRSLPMQLSQYNYYRYLNGKMDKEKFEKYIEYFNCDTSALSKSYIDHEILLLIGTKSDKHVIILDADNDGDLSDEIVLEYDTTLTRKEQADTLTKLPNILVKYDYFEKGKVVTKDVTNKPSPYLGSLGITYNTDDELEKKYYPFVSIPEHKKGQISLNGTPCEFFVSNGFISTRYKSKRVSVLIATDPDSIPSQLNGVIPYKLGDVFNVNNHDYTLDSISEWGDKLYVSYIGQNTRPTGVSEGLYVPKFEASNLNKKLFELSHHPDKYILLDFWGTWCNPCIKLIPELKELNAELSQDKFVMVSVAYDRDLQKVKDFVEKENMDWEHLFVSQQKVDENSLIKKLKVTSFPTTILIDPQGKIVGRNKSMEEIKAIVNGAE